MVACATEFSDARFVLLSVWHTSGMQAGEAFFANVYEPAICLSLASIEGGSRSGGGWGLAAEIEKQLRSFIIFFDGVTYQGQRSRVT